MMFLCTVAYRALSIYFVRCISGLEPGERRVKSCYGWHKIYLLVRSHNPSIHDSRERTLCTSETIKTANCSTN